MNMKNFLIILAVIQFFVLVLGMLFYAGQLVQYKNVCPKSENVSILWGGTIQLDTVPSINTSLLEVENGS